MKIAEPTLKSFAIERPDPFKTEQHLCLDKGYDSKEIDTLLDEYCYISHIRRRGIDYTDIRVHTPEYTPRRWVVERSHAWFNRFRRIILRWEKKAKHYLAFLFFACACITYKRAGIS